MSFLKLVIAATVLKLTILAPFRFFPTTSHRRIAVSIALPVNAALRRATGRLRGVRGVLLDSGDIGRADVFTNANLPGLFGDSLGIANSGANRVITQMSHRGRATRKLVSS